jgi:hypothetical protein
VRWVGHYTLTQNLKVLNLRVLSLIKCSTSTYLSNVRLSHSHLSQQVYIFLFNHMIVQLHMRGDNCHVLFIDSSWSYLDANCHGFTCTMTACISRSYKLERHDTTRLMKTQKSLHLIYRRTVMTLDVTKLNFAHQITWNPQNIAHSVLDSKY